MAKYSRKVVGSVYKAKEPGKPPYIKLRGDTAEELARALAGADKTKGLSLKLESKKNQLDSVNAAALAGKLSEEIAVKVRDRIEKIPDYVQFEIVLLETKVQS
jgi:hypothetical protein